MRVDMFEVSKDQFQLVLPLFSDIRNKAVFAHSVIEQTQRGAIFVNNIENPTTAFLTSCGGFYCLVGSPGNNNFNDKVVDFLNNESNHIGFYALALFSLEWEKAFDKYQLINANKIIRTYFQFVEHKFLENAREYNQFLDKDLEYRSLNEEISNIYREEFYSYYKHVWDSNSHFINSGMGHFITKGSNIISVCSSPYVGGGFAEIDIITIEDFKRRGFATKVGNEFINECRTKNILPNWCCHSENTASFYLAKKLGFERISEHPMYWYTC